MVGAGRCRQIAKKPLNCAHGRVDGGLLFITGGRLRLAGAGRSTGTATRRKKLK